MLHTYGKITPQHVNRLKSDYLKQATLQAPSVYKKEPTNISKKITTKDSSWAFAPDTETDPMTNQSTDPYSVGTTVTGNYCTASSFPTEIISEQDTAPATMTSFS